MCVVASFAEEKTWSVGIFVRIKKDVLAIVFVVAEKSVGANIRSVHLLSCTSIGLKLENIRPSTFLKIKRRVSVTHVESVFRYCRYNRWMTPNFLLGQDHPTVPCSLHVLLSTFKHYPSRSGDDGRL
jgi:hypothetical protein